ncbi:MAG: TonB family protein [Flavobacteriaceae bacterium]|jgi:protein TonB|nr:TonB family protein [Flavobacteriaceae bacterium]
MNPDIYSSFDELLFEKRNKNYGAYDLRAQQNYLMTKALIMGLGLCLFVMMVFYFYSQIQLPPTAATPAQTIYELIPPEEIAPKKEKVNPKETTSTSPLKKVNNLSPTPVRNTDVERTLATQTEIEGAEISTIDRAGVTNVSNTAVSNNSGIMNVTPPAPPIVSPSATDVYSAVDVDASFPGGTDALRNYVSAQMEYPEKALKNGTQGRVLIKFVVEKDGAMSGFKVVKGIGDGCEEEVIRILKKINKKWIPAQINGTTVRTYFTLPVAFKLNNFE